MSQELFQPNSSFWCKSRCPECNSINFTYNGHSQACDTDLVYDKCQCHECSKIYWLMDKDSVEDLYPNRHQEGEDGFVYQGVSKLPEDKL